jgi:hypothetical protein
MQIYTQREFERLSDDHQLHALVTAIDRDFPMKVWAFDGMTKDQQLYQLYKALANLVIPEVPPPVALSGMVTVFHVADFTTEVFNPEEDSNEGRGQALFDAFNVAMDRDTVTLMGGRFTPPTTLNLGAFTVNGQGMMTEINFDTGFPAFTIFGGSLSNLFIRFAGVTISGGTSYLSNVRIRNAPSGMAPIAIQSGGNPELIGVRLSGHSSQPCISSVDPVTIKAWSSYANREPDSNVTINPPGGMLFDPSV